MKVKITLWDLTGYMDIIFFNKNESESHVGLQNFDQSLYIYFNNLALEKSSKYTAMPRPLRRKNQFMGIE